MSAACDWSRFEAWFAVERQRRHSVAGLEHALFFEWLRLGQPAVGMEAAPEALVAAAPIAAPPAPAPRPARAPQSQAPRPAAPRPTGQPLLF